MPAAVFQTRELVLMAAALSGRGHGGKAVACATLGPMGVSCFYGPESGVVRTCTSTLTMNTQSQVLIDVWSDYVCPFCYLQVPLIERLQAAFADRVKIVWRAFELRADPKPTLEPAGEYLRTTWAKSVYPMAAERGMTLKLPPVQPRSRKAHEAAEFAETHMRFNAMHEALFRAFFEQGRDIGDLDVLCDIAASVELDPGVLRLALTENRYLPLVVGDESLALDLGVSAVPLMLVRPGDTPWGQAVPLSGAVPYETMHAVVQRLLDAPSQ
jgi:predicted DsbA family dithiol-disulfide isomerase